MGLLDGLLGRVLQGTGMSANADGANPLIRLALLVLQQNGGIQGLLAKLQQAGYGATGQSWIGTGLNQPIDADALTQALGHGQLGALAQSLGLAPQEAIGGLAQVLPHVVDHMTPGGHVPESATDMIAQALSALQHRAS
jgi:uncharacterized protein YidB (DUF937 family)